MEMGIPYQTLIPLVLLSHSDWEQRRKGATHLASLLAEAKLPVVRKELVTTFISRMTDSHKQVQKMFISLCGAFAAQVEHIRIYLKEMVRALTLVLADKNPELRESGLRELQALGTLVGQESILNLVQPLLGSESPFTKESLLSLYLEEP